MASRLSIFWNRRDVRKIYKQTISTYYEVKDGVVRILHTDPVLQPKVGQTVGKEAGAYAKGGFEHGTEKRLQA